MELYAVVKQSKYDYDFSVETVKHGIFVNRMDAICKAKAVFESLQEPGDEELENLEYDIDEEIGYFEMSFGYEEDYESHIVSVEEFKLSDSDTFQIYIKQQRDSLIEDIKEKAEQMEIDVSTIDLGKIAHRAERSLSNNDGLWESYWMSIEYALEEGGK
jgi:hypothetical protein